AGRGRSCCGPRGRLRGWASGVSVLYPKPVPPPPGKPSRASRPGLARTIMTDRQLHLLSPYRLPTSYPLQLAADETAAWLNGYAALWHPAALAGAAQPPQPSNSYDHDTPGTGFVYAVPQGPHLYQPDDWADRARAPPLRLGVLTRLGDPRPAAPGCRVAGVARGRRPGHALGVRRDAGAPRGRGPGAVRGAEGEGALRPAGECRPVLRVVPRP